MAKVLHFGPLSDAPDSEALQVVQSEDVKTVADADLIGFLHLRGQQWKKYLHTEKCRAIFSRQFSEPETTISNTDKTRRFSRPILFNCYNLCSFLMAG